MSAPASWAGTAGPSGPIRVLARACHPEPAVAVTVVAAALAAAAGRGVAGTAAVTVAVLAGQLSVGWSNDWIDASRDRATSRRDKPLVATGRDQLVRRAALTALVAVVPLSLLSGPRAGGMHLLAVAAAWSYNVWLKSSWASVLPYVVAFAALPAFVTLGLAGHPLPPWWVLVAGGALGAGAHLTNVLPDLDDDAATGIRGLPHRLGARTSTLLAAALLLGATVVLALGPAGDPGAFGLAMLAAALVTVAAVLAAGLRDRAAGSLTFRATLVLALLDVALLVARGDRLG